jgi:hypothetical protein
MALLAEFETPERLLAAIEAMCACNCAPRMETFTPFHVAGVDRALARPRSRLPLVMFCAGALGAVAGYGIQYIAMAAHYPLNVGGRPLHSWPAFVPVTFELTILFAALAGFIGVLAACRLPRPHHPVFDHAVFRRASQDRFFLLVNMPSVETLGREFEARLRALQPASISELRE